MISSALLKCPPRIKNVSLANLRLLINCKGSRRSFVVLCPRGGPGDDRQLFRKPVGEITKSTRK